MIKRIGTRKRQATVAGLALTAILAGCAPAPPPLQASCPPLRRTVITNPDSYPGQRARLALCIKSAARGLDLAGGPPAEAARAAVARCAPMEAAAVAALRKSGPVWPYQKAIIHDEVSHLALVAATQSRATGCGRKPGDPLDTLDDAAVHKPDG